MTGDAIEAYRRWQEMLAKYGDTHATTEAFFKLAAEIECNPFLDAQGFTAVLDQLHIQAFPNASTRPPRLYAHELTNITEG